MRKGEITELCAGVYYRGGRSLPKNRGRIEIQPRFKIQYPMKNHNKDAVFIAERCIVSKKNMIVFLRMPEKQKTRQDLVQTGICKYYF